MAISVVMPALEMAQETGKLVSWKKKEGEQVKKGEMLLEVETDKAVVEIEAGGDGVLSGVTAKVGDVVPVGQTIAWLLKPGEAVPGALADSSKPGGRWMRLRQPRPRRQRRRVGSASVAGARISPKARRLAREHGVDISKLRGSGPGGEILADDILKAAQAASGPAPVPSTPAAPAAPAPAARARRATAGWARGCRQLDRPHHGRAHDAELDERSAFLPGSRRRRQQSSTPHASA